MKGYEITFYYPQPKRRRNWGAIMFYAIILIAVALFARLLLG